MPFSRWKRLAETASIFLTVVGLYLVVMSLNIIVQENRLFFLGQRTQATVSKIEPSEDSPNMTVAKMKFMVGAKSYISFDDGNWGLKPKLGDSVTVIYDPKDPDSSRPMQNLLITTEHFLLGMAFLSISVIWRRKLLAVKTT